MTGVSNDQYAAGEQGLGYIYQPRFALLKLLQWPENSILSDVVIRFHPAIFCIVRQRLPLVQRVRFCQL